MYLNKNNVLVRKQKEVFMSRGVRYLAGICLAAGVLLALVVVVNVLFGGRGAVSNAAVNGEKTAVMDLYYIDDVYTNSGDFNTDSFSATKGNGDNLRIIFKNEGSQGANVKLFRYGIFGLNRKEVLSFSTDAGQTFSMKYSAGNADRGTYKVRISSQSGSKVDGALKISQL